MLPPTSFQLNTFDQMVLDLSAELDSHTPLSRKILQLDLSACKFLDTALALPTDFLSHFQLLQWGFSSHDSPASTSTAPTPNHLPPTGYLAVAQLHRLFEAVQRKGRSRQEPPYLCMSTISSLSELKPLFDAMATGVMATGHESNTAQDLSKEFDFTHSRLVAVATVLTTDFLESS